MKSVFVNVLQIYNAPGNEFYANSRELHVKFYTRWKMGSEAKITLNGLEALRPANPVPLQFSTTDVDESLIKFELFEERPYELLMASLTIPLTWFQPNTCVSENYPMKPWIAEMTGCPIASIDFHVSDNADRPFAAPRGQLLVTPSWATAGQPRERDKPALVCPDTYEMAFVSNDGKQGSTDTSSSQSDSEYDYDAEKDEGSQRSTSQMSRGPPITPASIRTRS